MGVPGAEREATVREGEGGAGSAFAGLSTFGGPRNLASVAPRRSFNRNGGITTSNLIVIKETRRLAAARPIEGCGGRRGAPVLRCASSIGGGA